MTDIYDGLKERSLHIFRKNNVLDEKITVRARTLTPEEAIGNPEGNDFPLQKGKERLMQAEFRGSMGQAFTDLFGNFEGSLAEIISMPLENNYRRAILVAALNAVLKHLGLIKGTVHCRDQGPSECAAEMALYIDKRFGRVKILQIGFQPRIAETLANTFPLRLIDLDPDNIGSEKFGIIVEGPETTDNVMEWADLLLVTGTTVTNNSIGRFLSGKPLIFYGTTIAGPAYLMGWDRFCAKSR